MTEQQATQRQRLIRIFGGIVLLACISATVPHLLVYAPSASLRKGWYLRDFAMRDIAIGDLVVVGMPEEVWSTAAIGGLPPRLLKQVAGVGGHRVCWDADGMTVVTAQDTVSYPYHAAKIGMRRPDACFTVPTAHLILVGTHPRSFDSRYIGMVDGHLLQFRVVPLWTWEAA